MKTSAIILSYKDDYETISKTLNAVKKCGIDEIVLINNGGRSKLPVKIKGVKIYTTESNLGSAGGYKFGMQKATQEYFWLLDADNIPKPNALNTLKEHYNGGAVCSYRARYGAIANLNTYNIKPIIGYNDVLGFNILRFWKRNKIWEQREAMQLVVSKIPIALYGGMFFHRTLVNIIGYPDISFHTFADDLDWSRRIVDFGMELLLVRDSIIEEVE